MNRIETSTTGNTQTGNLTLTLYKRSWTFTLEELMGITKIGLDWLSQHPEYLFPRKEAK